VAGKVEMQVHTTLPATVKCRAGRADCVPLAALVAFRADTMHKAGCGSMAFATPKTQQSKEASHELAREATSAKRRVWGATVTILIFRCLVR